MFQYQHQRLKEIISEILKNSLTADTMKWLNENSATTSARFGSAFVSMPRRTGRTIIQPGERAEVAINEARPGFVVTGWPLDRLARIWLILSLEPAPQDGYYKTLENLFLSAEVNELVALYSALPVLAYPEIWRHRCSEGIRSNIGDVLNSIMCNNPYPAENLDDAAWNQLVLKAFFTEKPIDQIVGLDLRANKQLAYTLSDYAHERWAAGRNVNPQLWRCISPFVDDVLLPDLEKIATSANPLEKEAAALAAYWSNNEKAISLIPKEYIKAIEAGESTWDLLAKKTTNYVLQ